MGIIISTLIKLYYFLSQINKKNFGPSPRPFISLSQLALRYRRRLTHMHNLAKPFPRMKRERHISF